MAKSKGEPTKRFLSVNDLIELLGIERRTLINRLNQGEFPNAQKMAEGRTAAWIIPYEDYLAYVARQTKHA